METLKNKIKIPEGLMVFVVNNDCANKISLNAQDSLLWYDEFGTCLARVFLTSPGQADAQEHLDIDNWLASEFKGDVIAFSATGITYKSLHMADWLLHYHMVMGIEMCEKK